MSESYTHKGYSIVPAEFRIPSMKPRPGWNICEGETIKKANFATVEIAKHYIDVVLVGRDGS